MKILLIAGHGAGDSGAVRHGYTEAILTRELAMSVRNKLSKYAEVDLFDTTKNMYKYLKAGNKFNFGAYDYVLEIHFNSSSGTMYVNNVTTGTEILIHSTEKGSSVEQRIVDNISALGFKNRGVKRSNGLFVMNTCKKNYGVSHALLETCFINDLDDMKLYQSKKEQVAVSIVHGIVDGFGLSQRALTVENAVKKLTEAGIINSPDYWLKAANSVEHLDTLLINFAKTL